MPSSSRVLLPRARMREVGLSNRFCPHLSVCLSSEKKNEILRFTGLMIPKSKSNIRTQKESKSASMYLTATKALRFYAFR